MKTIQVEATLHRGTRRIKLQFNYDPDLIGRVRQIGGCLWSKTLNCWHVPYSDESIEAIKKLKNDFGFEIPQLKKLIEERKTKYFDRKLTGEKEEAVVLYQHTLKSQRYSDKTIEAYTVAIQTFIGYFKDKDIQEITNDDIDAFNYSYILQNGFSASYQNQILSAIKLFYSSVLKKEVTLAGIQRPRRGRILPEIFSPEEVEKLLKAIRNIKHKSALALIYACGLRRSELINLRIKSVDSNRKLLIIKGAKGNKDRMVPLPESMIELLRTYYRLYRPKCWLFEGSIRGEQYSETSLREVFVRGMERAGITKKLTLHSLRHSYATHLLENGIDLRFIQELLGHKTSKTTEIYTHVTERSIESIKSPFEKLRL